MSNVSVVISKTHQEPFRPIFNFFYLSKKVVFLWYTFCQNNNTPDDLKSTKITIVQGDFWITFWIQYFGFPPFASMIVSFKSSRLWVFWSKVYHRKTTFFERQKNWKSAGGGRNRPERFLMDFGHHYRNIWHLSIKNFGPFIDFEKKYSQVTVGPLFPDSTVNVHIISLG